MLGHLLQTRQKLRGLESQNAEFRLNQSGGDPTVERQLSSVLEKQSDYRTARADKTPERRQEEGDEANIFFV